MAVNGQQINNLIREIGITQRRQLETRLRTEVNVTPEQGRALQMVAAKPGLIQREMADMFNRRGASVSSLLQNLERDGLITRQRAANNGRNKQIFLTEAGQRLVDRIQEEFEQANQGVTSQLTVDEQKMLIQLLQKLNNGEADHGDTL
ncbi:MarR family winged helix-turn-helix transcriptional regulator [Furfurilactobacillus sp. WILCCON 0119]|uniref:MarR family winged helix-turn-helix transcriptional regulator n=1 Tax=Furfurilactobacillus entadae TaxID=2922307 RepID=UPI0035E50FA3